MVNRGTQRRSRGAGEDTPAVRTKKRVELQGSYKDAREIYLLERVQHCTGLPLEIIFPVHTQKKGIGKCYPSSEVEEVVLVLSLGKALNGMPPSLCGRQMVGPSSLPVVVAQSDERHANRA